jgi:tRNA dimethylallyltransferase
VGSWLADVGKALQGADAAGALPILVGGTGLYFKALTEGLAPVPPIPAEVGAKWGARLEREGSAALHARLGELDAVAAARIRPGDAQRVVRALQVLDATGRPLREWQEAASSALLPGDAALRLVIQPDRRELNRRVDARLDGMVHAGAVEEVRALLDRRLDPALPAMKAIGVKEFGSFLRDEISLEEAIRQAKTATRRYAKRQMTWLRNQMCDWIPADL